MLRIRDANCIPALWAFKSTEVELAERIDDESSYKQKDFRNEKIIDLEVSFPVVKILNKYINFDQQAVYYEQMQLLTKSLFGRSFQSVTRESYARAHWSVLDKDSEQTFLPASTLIVLTDSRRVLHEH